MEESTGNTGRHNLGNEDTCVKRDYTGAAGKWLRGFCRNEK